MNNYNENEYEPTQDEWDKIEELILREETEETKEEQKERADDLLMWKSWCKENGMSW